MSGKDRKRKGEREKKKKDRHVQKRRKGGERAVPRRFCSIYSRCTLYTVKFPILFEA